MYILKRKISQKEQGFTLLEVIVSILIMTTFVSVSLQLMAVAALLKAKARVSTEAISWIQQDMELIKYQAAIYQNTFLSASANINASTITVNSGTDFAATNKVLIGSDTNTYTISSISGNTLTISPNLQQAATQNDQVVGITRCSTTATPTTNITGFADGLRVKIRDVALATSSTPSITNVVINTSSNIVTFPKKITTTNTSYNMTRNTTVDTTAPYNQLKVYYEVKATTGGAEKAKSYIELVPSAAYECPSS